ncbi:hypothetical protein GJAV_G00019710 [Gymnothorax javanicus]|nr:hypothetical protein GJAV_G00019710 [Gymnothorax javanicus]
MNCSRTISFQTSKREHHLLSHHNKNNFLSVKRIEFGESGNILELFNKYTVLFGHFTFVQAELCLPLAMRVFAINIFTLLCCGSVLSNVRDRPHSRLTRPRQRNDTVSQNNLLENPCKGKPLDFVFVIDSSRSVRPHDFQKVKTFMANILRFLDVGPDATRVGLVQYGSVVQKEFSLKTFTRRTELEQAVQEMVHLATGTMTGLALEYTMNVAFSEAEGARPLHQHIPRVAMVITDGRPQDKVAEVAAQARKAGIQIFAIGVGRVDMKTLRAIGSEPHSDYVYLVANFSQMQRLTSVFQSKLCREIDQCALGTHDCEQECVNKGVSFVCRCHKGYKLNPDGKICKKLECRDGPLDLVFVIDGSKSLGLANFQLVKQFVIGIVEALNVSAGATQVGLLQYSTKVRSEFALGQFSSGLAVAEAVSRVQYMGRGSMTGSALRHMFEFSFSAKEGARPNAHRIGIVFTDGRSQDDVSKWATKAQESGITIYAVGVGKAIEEELREIASEPDDMHLFYTEDFSLMSQISNKLKSRICEETPTHEDLCKCEHTVKFQSQATGQLWMLTKKHIL